MAPQRFAQFHPSIFLYQVYVGNDLFDIRYPTNWRTISRCEMCIGSSPTIRIIGYLNYRLRQVKETRTSRQGHILSLAGTAVAASAARDTILSRTLRYQGQTLCAR